MIARLPAQGPAEAWMLLGSPCANDYVRYRL
jgi:hypothetical protein